MNDFFAALQFLTCCPWPGQRQRVADEMGRSTVFFPVVGLLLGALLALLDWLLRPVAGAAISSIVLVAIVALVTRGLHLDGLSDTVDGLGAGGSRDQILEVMDDSHIGVFGTVALVLVLFLKVRGIEALDENRWRVLMIAPVLSRWAMVLLMYRSKAARPGLGALMINYLKQQYFLLATVITIVLMAITSPTIGLLLMTCCGLIAIGFRSYFHRRLGGITGDICGAVGELTETSVLVLSACGLR